MLNIRRTNNLDLIARLDRRIFDAGDHEDEIDPATLWWIVEFAGKVAGFCGLRPITENGKRYGYLSKAGLLPAARGFGLQRNLIMVRDKEAAKLGLEANLTYTAGGNFASANNLIKCGYVLYDPANPWGLKHSLYFWKDL